MNNKKLRTIQRVRSKISGTALRPRLAVFRSNKHLSAQLIDDTKGTTLIAVSDMEIKDEKKKTDLVGKLLAQKALKKNIKAVVFDRRAYKYHGQIKALADGAKAEGLIV